jgi:hypothetical protein
VTSPEELYTFRALWRQYRACRRNKRSTLNQLAFEVDVEANLGDSDRVSSEKRSTGRAHRAALRGSRSRLTALGCLLHSVHEGDARSDERSRCAPSRRRHRACAMSRSL